jgi:ketosteroid isomerase-like protein
VSNAKSLLEQYLFNFRDIEKASALFAEDGAFEMPYFVALGLPTRFEGPEGVKGALNTVLGIYPEFKVEAEDLTVHIDTGDKVFAEYRVHAVAAPTGRLTHHLFMAYLVAKEGKIALLREGLNTVAAASAFLQGGVRDLPAPTDEVHAF